jgi:hypothetical protein
MAPLKVGEAETMPKSEALRPDELGQEAIEPAEIAEHLDRLVKSDLLCRSATLSHLLEYLVAKALLGEHLKEVVIARELFHRGQDFDGKLDNIVRVHAHRLRRALDTWYRGEGACDKVRFSIPRGSYMVHILRHGADEERDPAVRLSIEAIDIPTAPGPTGSPAADEKKGPGMLLALLGCFCAGALVTYAGLAWSGRLAPAAVQSRTSPDGILSPPLAAIWKSIFRPGVNTVVSFTNPLFLRTNDSVSRAYIAYNGPITAPVGTAFKMNPDDPFVNRRIAGLGPLVFNESWTGIGEMRAVHKLSELAGSSGFRFRLVRGRALTYDDMKGSNVIFLGSPWANDMQAKFNIGITPFQCFGTENIVNNDPKNGEPAAYFPELNPTTKQLIASYGLFSVLPGLDPGTKIVSSSGIDQYATLAALDLMTSPDGVREVMRRFGVSSQQTLPEYFQAVVRTEIIRGDPANTAVVTVRALKAK